MNMGYNNMIRLMMNPMIPRVRILMLTLTIGSRPEMSDPHTHDQSIQKEIDDDHDVSQGLIHQSSPHHLRSPI